MIYSLKNPIKNFPWGSRTAICDYFDIANPTLEHQAELWMGAHPTASSSISQEGVDVTLCDVITNDPDYWLGKQARQYFSSLPFLMKILAAEEPLSIQVHPSKRAAELGFIAENEQGIPLDAANRNYRDANHKPELVYAITPYLAMNGFREFGQIVENFDLISVASIEDIFSPFKQKPCSSTLAVFFSSLLGLTGDKKEQAITELLASLEKYKSQSLEALVLIERFHKLYPTDIGIFSPLFLNVIELKPGQAMFLYAETPHAYVNGVGIEIMANSDNVLRAGLTSKHIDVEELTKNTRFEPVPFERLVMEPEKQGQSEIYPIPVSDFKFDVLVPKEVISLTVNSAEILFCISASVIVTTDTESKILKKGDSVAIAAGIRQYKVFGDGVIARAYF